jgi:hypothetical protein
MNLMVLVQKTRCEIHGKPLWRRRLETTVKYWIRQTSLEKCSLSRSFGVQDYIQDGPSITNMQPHSLLLFLAMHSFSLSHWKNNEDLNTVCFSQFVVHSQAHWGSSPSCTKSHVPTIEHDKKGAFIICELSKKIDVLLFPLILSKGFRGLKVRQKKWRPYRHTNWGSLQIMLQSSDCLLQIPSFPPSHKIPELAMFEQLNWAPIIELCTF